ncbi:hypothetical protein TorRG33x02_356190 [Trema orientale]|uniref:Uncharacterized protein n=1 Tax=Trema orientale TaxID=63057 RepID=A0A2P5A7Q3_TREOI|nr:hypothetical protein TorRG33x02_356190 [Trema orientale]
MLFRGVEVPAKGGHQRALPPAPPSARSPCPVSFPRIVELGIGDGVGGRGRSPLVVAAAAASGCRKARTAGRIFCGIKPPWLSSARGWLD